MTKRIVILLIVFSLTIPSIVHAKTYVEIDDQGSYIGFTKRVLKIKQGHKKKDYIEYYDDWDEEVEDNVASRFHAKFKSSNKKIATVSKKGVVHAKKFGTVYITAIIKISDETFKIKNKVIVVPKAELKTKKVTIYCGDKYRVRVKGKRKNVKKWKSKNTRIATVTSSGRITGKHKGKTTITCRINGLKRSIKVKVINQHIQNSTLRDGERVRLSIGSKKIKTNSCWSSNTKVIKITNHGTVTALKTGKATVHCKTGGIWIKKRITVTPNKVYNIKKNYTSLSDIPYNTIRSDYRALYFSGKKLILKMVILNKTAKTVKKITYGKFKMYKGNKWILSKSVVNKRINVKPFKKKTIKIVLSKKRNIKRKVDLTMFWFDNYKLKKVEGFYYD